MRNTSLPRRGSGTGSNPSARDLSHSVGECGDCFDDGQRYRYTFSDVWHAVQTEPQFNYVFWIHITLDILKDKAMQCFGAILVLIAFCLISAITAMGFGILLPAIAEYGTCWYWFNVAYGFLLVVSILFHYYMAVMTKPGQPKDVSSDEVTFTSTICKKCNYLKPLRSHHCSVCNCCVMKMDHHCPWTANCIGQSNYRYFVSFLIWVTLATWHVTSVSAPVVFRSGSFLFPLNKPSIPQTAFQALFQQNTIYSLLYNSYSEKIKHTKQLKQEQADFHHKMDEVEHIERHMGADRLRGNQLYLSNSIDSESRINRRLSDEKSSDYDNTGSHIFVADVASSSSARAEGVDTLTLVEWIFPDQELVLFMTFMLSLGVLIAVGSLTIFHLMLIAHGYTTLEFFRSIHEKRRCRVEGRAYVHPFDRGILKNFEEVFGDVPWVFAILPSTRQVSPVKYYIRDDNNKTVNDGISHCTYTADPQHDFKV